MPNTIYYLPRDIAGQFEHLTKIQDPNYSPLHDYEEAALKLNNRRWTTLNCGHTILHSTCVSTVLFFSYMIYLTVERILQIPGFFLIEKTNFNTPRAFCYYYTSDRKDYCWCEDHPYQSRLIFIFSQLTYTSHNAIKNKHRYFLYGCIALPYILHLVYRRQARKDAQVKEKDQPEVIKEIATRINYLSSSLKNNYNRYHQMNQPERNRLKEQASAILKNEKQLRTKLKYYITNTDVQNAVSNLMATATLASTNQGRVR